MNIAYVRVSTKEQNTARQFAGFKIQGIEIEQVYCEKISGKDTNRPELQSMLNFVRKGDTVYVESISRLARSTKDLLDIVDQLQSKQVEFVSLKENIDTHTPQGKFMLTVFSALAQLEREQIKQRQAEGIAIAKEQGKLGRPEIKISSNTWNDNYKLWQEKQITAKVFMEREQMKRTTFYKLLREYENNK